MARRNAFTLVELLVVMVIIALLMGLLFPAIQAARESARKTACRNNLYQMARAILNYESSLTRFPSSWNPPNPYPSTAPVQGWSAQAVLLPYLEQKATHSAIDYNSSYNGVSVTTADGVTTEVAALRVPTYLCPSEIQDEARLNGSGVAEHYPLNYAVNLGTWFVWNPVNRKGGEGAFYPMSKLTAGDFLDGQSYTLALAEVKGWTPYFRNVQSASPTMPTVPTAVASLGGTFKENSGHTEWVDGRSHQIGFTAQFAPNTRVPYTSGSVTYDIDWTNNQEGVLPSSGPAVSTWAVITARSYHEGMVNVAMMDGSVRPIENDINLGVWQALASRRGKEILPENY